MAIPGETLPGVFRRFRSEIDEALRKSLDADGTGVYRMLRYTMGWTDVCGRPVQATVGKALRPTLCLLACEASGGDVSRALPPAVALELIHNFSLIHDEIQDRDEVRHHRPTLWAVWGDPKALVAGNTLRIIADQCLWDLVARGETFDQALAAETLLTEAYLDMIEGQYMDLSFEGRPDIGLGDYMAMISRKTGALIRSSLAIGALIGSRDDATVRAFADCGRSLGFLFQIRDDMLGIWGDESTTGKPVGADIRRKKNSLPVVYAMSQARGSDRELLMEVYGRTSVGDNDVDGVLAVMDRLGAARYCQELAEDSRRTAMEAIEVLELSPPAIREMDELARFLLVRDY